MLSVLAGFFAGCVHVLAGPDHLAAVAPLAVEERRRTWRLGFRWGLGHSGGVMLVGAGVLLLRGILPVEALSTFSEHLVGVVLIGIGLWALRKAFDKRVHGHPHTHGDRRHTHIHVHDPAIAHATARAHAGHTHAALAVGTLHGLAGSSHILGVLPALALPSTGLAVGYMAAFGLGTILGMSVFASVVGLVARRFALNSVTLYRGMAATCAVAAILVGGVWLAG